VAKLLNKISLGIGVNIEDDENITFKYPEFCFRNPWFYWKFKVHRLAEMTEYSWAYIPTLPITLKFM